MNTRDHHHRADAVDDARAPRSRRRTARAVAAQASWLNSSGRPVKARPRKLNIRNPCRRRSVPAEPPVMRVGGQPAAVRDLHAHSPSSVESSSLDRRHSPAAFSCRLAPEPQRRVEAEEREHAQQQHLHELRRVVQHGFRSRLPGSACGIELRETRGGAARGTAGRSRPGWRRTPSTAGPPSGTRCARRGSRRTTPRGRSRAPSPGRGTCRGRSSSDCSWQVPHSVMTSSFHPSTSDRRISCAVWQFGADRRQRAALRHLRAVHALPGTRARCPRGSCCRCRESCCGTPCSPGRTCARMSWLPWQSVHVGATLRPLLMRAFPWMLSLNRSTTLPISILPRLMISSLPWQRPQVSMQRAWWVRDAGSADGMMSWLPWQSAQVAAARLPPRAPRLGVHARCRRPATAVSWQVAHCAGFSFSACGHSASAARSVWQSTHARPPIPWIDARERLRRRPPPTGRRRAPPPASPWHARQSSLVGRLRRRRLSAGAAAASDTATPSASSSMAAVEEHTHHGNAGATRRRSRGPASRPAAVVWMTRRTHARDRWHRA